MNRLVQIIKQNDEKRLKESLRLFSKMFNKDKINGLMIAAAYNKPLFIKYFKHQITQQSRSGRTALMFAAEHDNYNFITPLIKEANMQDSYGFTALMICVIKNSQQFAQALMRQNVDLCLRLRRDYGGAYRQGMNALLIAAMHKNQYFIKLLLPYEICQVEKAQIDYIYQVTHEEAVCRLLYQELYQHRIKMGINLGEEYQVPELQTQVPMVFDVFSEIDVQNDQIIPYQEYVGESGAPQSPSTPAAQLQTKTQETINQNGFLQGEKPRPSVLGATSDQSTPAVGAENTFSGYNTVSEYQSPLEQEREKVRRHLMFQFLTNNSQFDHNGCAGSRDLTASISADKDSQNSRGKGQVLLQRSSSTGKYQFLRSQADEECARRLSGQLEVQAFAQQVASASDTLQSLVDQRIETDVLKTALSEHEAEMAVLSEGYSQLQRTITMKNEEITALQSKLQEAERRISRAHSDRAIFAITIFFVLNIYIVVVAVWLKKNPRTLEMLWALVGVK